MELSSAAIVAMVFTAFSIGIAKSGLPGLVTVITPFVAMTMPSRIATGIMLPLLIVAGIVSVIYWRRKALWQYLGWLIPGAVAGLALGFLLLRAIDDATFTPIMGWLIIIVSLLSFGLDRFTLRFDKDNKVIPLAIGLIAGIFNMLANGAAPVLALYLLALKINKEDFVGTNAWFFLVINIAKLPFSIAIGSVQISHLGFDAMLLPLIAVGGLVGVRILKKIPQNIFNISIQALALISGARLLF